MSLSLRIFTSDNVLLADAEAPAPATIIVDASSGKISEVRQGRARRSDFPEVPDDDWVDAGKQWIIPGLVESASLLFSCSRIKFKSEFEVPMFISTNLDELIGRVSIQGLGPLPQGA